MANIVGNNPPVLNDTDYVDKIKNSLDAVDTHDHTSGKGVPIGASAIADGSITEAKQAIVLANASKFLERDVTGAVVSTVHAVPTGTVVGTSDTQTLTNKTIDGDSNTVQDLPLTAIKTNLPEASNFMVRDASGVPTSATKAVPSGVVVGTTDTQTLTNKTITSPAGLVKADVGLGNVDNTSDATKNAAVATLTNKTLTGNIAVNLVSGAATVTLPTTTSTLATLALNETLTNKTLTAPTINTALIQSGTFDVLSATEQGSVPTTPAAGTLRFYAKTDDKLYTLNSAGTEAQVGSGAGGGAINYISANSDAESATTGWATYKDAAGSLPVDGTGGSPTLTFTRTTSSPLRGVASFLVTTTAANLQGEGASFDFTVPAGDFAKPISISFDYNIASGTYVTGDMIVYIYDVTNSTLIQPAGYQIQGLGSTLANKHIATFQTSSTGTSYRLIFHRAVSTSSAMTMKIDNVQVGPQVVQYGAPVTDWVSYTPVTGFTTNNTITGLYRRVGDSVEVRIRQAFTGAPAGSGTYQLPPGLSLDTAKLNTLGVNSILGLASLFDSSANNTFSASVKHSSSTTVLIQAIDDVNTSDHRTDTFTASHPFTIATGDLLDFEFSAPIIGWSSTVQMSNDTDTRVVAARYTTCTTSVGTSIAPMVFTSKDFDTHNAYNTTTGSYVAPVPGYYRVTAGFATGSGTAASVNVGIYVSARVATVNKGVLSQFTFQQTSSALNASGTGSCIVYANAGDSIDAAIQRDANAPAVSVASGIYTYLNIERLAGPSAIAAVEKVQAKYTASAATTIANSSATVVDYATRVYDSHGAVTTGASWKFTAPRADKYRISACSVSASGGGWAAGEEWDTYIYKNSVQNSALHLNFAQATHSTRMTGSGSTTISLLAGETIDVRIFQSSGASINTTAGADENWVAIESVS